jgi:acyl-CoA synthetase (AMP-forming)/AMP-acid ligase II
LTCAPATTADGGANNALAAGGVRLSFWQDGERAEFGGAEFWRLVAGYIDLVDGLPQLGNFVLIISRTNPDMMALFLALMASRRPVSFFPPNSPIQDEASYFEQQRGALSRIAPSSIVIFDRTYADTIATIDSGLADKVVMLPRLSRVAQMPSAHDWKHGLALFNEALMHDPKRVLFVQHSSGTTGIKKAVAIEASALQEQFASYWPVVRSMAGGDVRVASWLPLYHDMGLLAGFLLPLIGGAHISMVDPFEWIARPVSLFDMIEHDACNMCWLPNFAFRHLIRLRKSMPERRLASVRAWIDCSEPCRYRDAKEFELAFAQQGVAASSVAGCYAMAETVFAVTQSAPQEQRALRVRRDVVPGDDLPALGAEVVAEPAPAGDSDHALVLSSGRVLPGIDVRIYVDGNPATQEGIYGEIGVRGRFVFSGYRGLSAQDSNIGADSYYRTGDLGVLIDGHLYVFGRVKETIIVNGKNIFAGDVEDIVNAVAGVKKGRVVALGIESEQTGSENLVIVAERDGSAAASDGELRAAIARLIADAFLVHPYDVRIVEAPWIVKSTSGKISRRENRLRYLQAFGRKTTNP